MHMPQVSLSYSKTCMLTNLTSTILIYVQSLKILHDRQYLIQWHKNNYYRKANATQLKSFTSRTAADEDKCRITKQRVG